MKNKVVILSSDVIGPNMAGPGIRYLRMAEAVSDFMETTFIVPKPVPQIEFPFKVISNDSSNFKKELNSANVIITQGYNFPLYPLLMSSARLIIDMYDPVPFELLGQLNFSEITPEQKLLYLWTLRKTNLLVKEADFFLCATERQKTLWTGLLLANGKIDSKIVQSDPLLNNLFTIFPFGIDDKPIIGKSDNVFQKLFPAISSNDVIFFWGGGMWDWLDPFIVIEAAKRAIEVDQRIKVIFLAGKHPNPDIPKMHNAEKCRQLAIDYDLFNKNVFFVEHWLPFDERQFYLKAADVGITFHKKRLEAKYSFRTRVLDYLWAGLPVLATSGDELSEEISRKGGGKVIAADDEAQLTKEMLNLASSSELRTKMSIASLNLSKTYLWSIVSKDFLKLVKKVNEMPSKKISKTEQWSRLVMFYGNNIVNEIRNLGLKKTIIKRIKP